MTCQKRDFIGKSYCYTNVFNILKDSATNVKKDTHTLRAQYIPNTKKTAKKRNKKRKIKVNKQNP